MLTVTGGEKAPSQLIPAACTPYSCAEVRGSDQWEAAHLSRPRSAPVLTLPRSLTAAAFRGGEAGCASESELDESELESPDEESSELESEEPLLLLPSLEELQVAIEVT